MADVRAIARYLRREWNPIGGNDLPEDEYDGEAYEVYCLLMRDADRRTIAEYLGHGAGFRRRERHIARDLNVAEKIVNWWRAFAASRP